MGHAPSSFFVRRSIECLVPDGLSWTQEQSLPVVKDMDIGYHFMLNVNFVFFRERHENRLLAQRDDADRDWPLSGRARLADLYNSFHVLTLAK